MQEDREFHFFNIVEGDSIIIDLEKDEEPVDLGEIYDDNNNYLLYGLLTDVLSKGNLWS